MKLLFVIGSFLFIALAVIAGPTLEPADTFPSPLDPSPPAVPTESGYSPLIYGFLPYWTLNKFNSDNLKYLTDLVYFGVTVTESGELVKSDLGYRRFIANYSLLRDLAETHQLKLHLVIKAPDDQQLFNFLHDASAHAQLTSELQTLGSNYPVDGYNIDFEPSNATNSATIAKFTEFVNSLHAAIKPSDHLTIDIYPSAAASPKLWDLPALVPFTDQFIVMTYDYTRTPSSFSGPIAPLYPPPGKRHAVVVNLKEISGLVPPNKIIVGLPLYGYQWRTQDESRYSAAIKGTGSLATLGRIRQLLDTQNLIPFKDPQTLSSRIVLRDNGGYSQIHYEDTSTISEKIEFVSNAQFGGLALWALGYEGDYDIWTPINSLMLP